VRPVLTGREPADVLSYARLHSRFPNESTANQWFKESQFESYRRLGLFAGRSMTELLGRFGGPDRIVDSPEAILRAERGVMEDDTDPASPFPDA
jgi:hypothetical protein